MSAKKDEFEAFMNNLFDQSTKVQRKKLRKIAKGLDLSKIPKTFNVPAEYIVGNKVIKTN